MGRMIFKPAARYPADPRAVFILALSVFSGLTSLALHAAPQSLEALLPRWAVVGWSILLLSGSLIALVGMAFQTINGIIAEQIGSVVVGATTIFYSGIAIYFIGPSALQSVGIITAWGVACFVRWIQLQVLIHNGVKRAAKEAFLARIHAEIEAREARERAEHLARSERYRR
jgi:hypothetical protein